VATLLPNIEELSLLGAFDRGVPNKERIVIRSRSVVDIGNFAVVLGTRFLQTGNVVPVKDTMFWFGSGTVSPDDWVFLYTGPGMPVVLPTEDHKGRLILVYWGREHTLFHDPVTEPVLWRLSGIEIPKPAEALPQAGLLTTARG
jgi:hypothetical protein